MDIFNSDFKMPLFYDSNDFILFPTNQDFYLSDYEAVMANQAYLRIWGQSEWPEEDFTPEQNRDDLQFHIEDNQNHEAYGYMIYSPDKKICYGSLYVNPLTSVFTNYGISEEQDQLLRTCCARIDCWIDQNVSIEFEQRIIESMQAWLSKTWQIKPVFTARVGLDRRIQIYDKLKFKPVADVRNKEGDSLLLFIPPFKI